MKGESMPCFMCGRTNHVTQDYYFKKTKEYKFKPKSQKDQVSPNRQFGDWLVGVTLSAYAASSTKKPGAIITSDCIKLNDWFQNCVETTIPDGCSQNNMINEPPPSNFQFMPTPGIDLAEHARSVVPSPNLEYITKTMDLNNMIKDLEQM
ncbi:Uncharacterized protein Fot_11646 [Forsythia ovata]|uniref:CCHC-type domain-containing protein n=1 Tax=Forsythia ovata TaxID=205694 RepID=A0ABD1WKN5_9LAMI